MINSLELERKETLTAIRSLALRVQADCILPVDKKILHSTKIVLAMIVSGKSPYSIIRSGSYRTIYSFDKR